MKIEREMRRFGARSVTGREYTVIEYQEFTREHASDGEKEVGGLKRLATSEGFAVRRIEAGSFQVINTGDVVREVAPQER